MIQEERKEKKLKMLENGNEFEYLMYVIRIRSQSKGYQRNKCMSTNTTKKRKCGRKRIIILIKLLMLTTITISIYKY